MSGQIHGTCGEEGRKEERKEGRKEGRTDGRKDGRDVMKERKLWWKERYERKEGKL